MSPEAITERANDWPASASRAVDTPTPPDPLDRIERTAKQIVDQAGDHWFLAGDVRRILATPDPSIPERPDLRALMTEMLEFVPPSAPVADEARAYLGSIPERPAEPLRALAEATLAMLDVPFRLTAESAETDAGPLSIARAKVRHLARAALAQQSTPESRDE